MKHYLFTVKFWKCAAHRALRTVFQTAASTLATTPLVLDGINWKLVTSASVAAGVASLIMAAATGIPEAEEEEDPEGE